MDASRWQQQSTISNRALIVRIIYSSVGVSVGLSVFMVFSFQFNNYNAGLWGLCSGIAAALALGVTVAYKRQAWTGRERYLKGFMLSGCFIQLAGVCGFVSYLVLAITLKQDLTAYGEGYYLTCVWCFMTWKWGFGLFLYSRRFLRSCMADKSLLTQEQGRGGSYSAIAAA